MYEKANPGTTCNGNNYYTGLVQSRSGADMCARAYTSTSNSNASWALYGCTTSSSGAAYSYNDHNSYTPASNWFGAGGPDGSPPANEYTNTGF